MNGQVAVSNNDGRNPTFAVRPNVALLLCGRNKVNGVVFGFYLILFKMDIFMHVALRSSTRRK